MRRKAAWWIAVVAALTTSVAACSSGGTERSAESFCDELDRSGAALDERTANAGDDLAEQVSLIFENVSDFNAMLHRLEDRAPDEIRSDMEVAVDAWDKQAELAADALDNPLGALASAVSSGVMSSSSMEAIDAYAEENCGRVVFGVLTTAGNGTSSEPTTQSCPQVSAITAALTQESSFKKLEEAVSDLDEIGDDVDDATDDLQAAFEDLDPAPRYAREALGRINFNGDRPAALLTPIDDAIEEICGEVAFGPLDETVVVPAPAGTRVNVGGAMYGTACQSESSMLGGTTIAVGVPFVQIFTCPDGLAFLDLTSGIPAYVEAASVQGNGVVNGGDRMVWISTEETPASGLNPVSNDVTLHVQPLDGSEELNVALVTDHPDSLDSTPTVVHAWRDRIITLEEALDGSTSFLVTRDGAGEEVGRVDLRAEDLDPDAAMVTSNLFMLDGGQRGDALLDLRTGGLVRLAEDDLYPIANGLCHDRAYIYADSFEAATTWKLAGGAISGPTTWSYDQETRPGLRDASAARRDVIVAGTETQEIVGLGPDGAIRWTVPQNVAYGVHEVVAGWLYITNMSKQQVLADPVTGTEVSGLSRDVTDILTAVTGDGGYSAMFDEVTGKFTFASGNEVWQVPLGEICPP